MNTLRDDIQQYKPAIALNRLATRNTLHSVRFFLFIVFALAAAGYVGSEYALDGQYNQLLLGASLVSLTLWLEQLLTFAYSNSFYFKGLNSLIGSSETNQSGTTYDVAEIILNNEHDVAEAFCNSSVGSTILFRAGAKQEAIGEYLRNPRQQLTADMVILPENEIFSLIGLGKYLLKHDKAFVDMLAHSGVTKDTFIGALRWVVGTIHQEKRAARWWSKDNLSRTKGIGREWSYGHAFLLQKFSRDIRTSAVFSTLAANTPFALEKISEIESTLARSKEANVLLIGEPGVGKIDLVMAVQRRMQTGKSLSAISGQQLVVLDTNRLFATHPSKQSFELALIQIFTEAVLAGNIIIVIENLSVFIDEAAVMGIHIPELIDQYLATPDVKVVATDTPAAFHSNLEPLGGFTRRFSEILIDTPDLSATTRVLQSVALQHERKYKTFFTYAALHALTTAADRYIVEGVLPDKAIALLIDVASAAKQQNINIITEEFVYTTVSTKTGVPAGPITTQERDVLLHLEDKLHQHVIGQEQAIDAISRTMRRARAGVQSADKPIGSFLFLGPTGVGKTETAKALATVFFGGEDKMRRIDMSEFSGANAVPKLIGNGESAGVLPTILREHPYSVLLLDEFEKATQSVHDIFLQVLDEGIFTDSKGSKVNARNTIIIATSNAGSKLILNTVHQRKELSTLSAEIIQHIIKTGVYRPELINRFDSTIIFEPLSLGQQTEVANMLLNGLYERIQERGYQLHVHEDLLSVLVKKGYSPEFGARPMQRVLQDVIEEKVAQKIIAGSVQKGEPIRLSLSDFSEAELNV
jgi:ATP-dependent Clp protease ATP-binding subunit ClpC